MTANGPKKSKNMVFKDTDQMGQFYHSELAPGVLPGTANYRLALLGTEENRLALSGTGGEISTIRDM